MALYKHKSTVWRKILLVIRSFHFQFFNGAARKAPTSSLAYWELMQHQPNSSFCPCSGLHSSSFDTSSWQAAHHNLSSAGLPLGSLGRFATFPLQLIRYGMMMWAVCYCISISPCHRKENNGKLSITTPEKLHYCFPTPTALQALGILGNKIPWQVFSAFSTLH